MGQKRANGTNIIRNSGAHILLLYAKMVKKPFSLPELHFFPKLSTSKRASLTANQLKAKGYLVKHPGTETWQITSDGIDVIYRLSGTPRLKSSQDD